MRNPVRSETDAFYVGVGQRIGHRCIARARGAARSGGRRGALRRRRRRRLDLGGLHQGPGSATTAARGRLAAPARSGPTRRRVLVVANRTLQAIELREELHRRAATRGRAPRRRADPDLTGALHRLRRRHGARRGARARLDARSPGCEDEGIDVTGKVGDPNAALGAIEDELRRHAADEVIISTYPRGKSNWLETGIVERLREELDIPVTHVVAGSSPASPLSASSGSGLTVSLRVTV